MIVIAVKIIWLVLGRFVLFDWGFPLAILAEPFLVFLHHER